MKGRFKQLVNSKLFWMAVIWVVAPDIFPGPIDDALFLALTSMRALSKKTNTNVNENENPTPKDNLDL